MPLAAKQSGTVDRYCVPRRMGGVGANAGEAAQVRVEARSYHPVAAGGHAIDQNPAAAFAAESHRVRRKPSRPRWLRRIEPPPVA